MMQGGRKGRPVHREDRGETPRLYGIRNANQLSICVRIK
jgi:hypothetical protein